MGKSFLYVYAAPLLCHTGIEKMKQLLTPEELGEHLGIAVQTIYNRHSRGLDLPPHIKIGRLLRFPSSLLEAWIVSKLPQQTQIVLPTASPSSPVAPARRGRPTKAEQFKRAQALLHST
jgi:predicted DNA-binding transcriptional regulator AlpA